MNTKFEFVDGDTIEFNGTTLRRIRALRDIQEFNVKVGDLGGYLEKEENLSPNGLCWVSDNAQVFGDARVSDNALVFGEVRVSGEARVSGDALVFDKAWVYGDARVSDNAQVFGDARVSDNALVFGEAQVFGDARVSDNAQVSGEASISPICISGFRWTVTLTDKHMRIGCQVHGIEAWDEFTDAEIAAMDAKNALRFWQEHKDWLMTQARAHAKKAAEAKSKVQ